MRVKEMKGICVIVAFLVIGSLCFADIEPDVTVVVVEPNDPNWLPSDCFIPAWETVTLSAVLSNPEEVSNAVGYESQQTLSINCNMYKGDLQNLISDTTFLHPFNVRAVDDQNNVYTSDYAYSLLHIDTTPSPSFLSDRAGHLSLTFPMDPNAGYPVWFKEVSWSINGLFAYAIRTVKVPFQASDQWIELLPGYSIMIEEAVLEEGKYSYLIRAKYEGTGSIPRSYLTIRDDDPVPQYIDIGMRFLDVNGVDVRSYSMGGGFSSGSSGSNNDYTLLGSGSCDGCGNVATIEFRFAVDSYVQEMLYVLNDIPVPVF